MKTKRTIRRPISKAAARAVEAARKNAPQRARAYHKRHPAEQASHFASQCTTLGPFVSSAAIESSRGFGAGAYDGTP